MACPDPKYLSYNVPHAIADARPPNKAGNPWKYKIPLVSKYLAFSNLSFKKWNDSIETAPAKHPINKAGNGNENISHHADIIIAPDNEAFWIW